jgi:acetyltransferase-like isoleucine patch superfamily enzyme
MSKVYKNYLSSDCKIDKSAFLDAPVRIYGQAKLSKKVRVGQFSYVNTRTTIHSGSSVGRFCSIGKNVEVGPFNHPMERLSTSPVSYNAHLHFPNEQGDFVRSKLVRENGVKIGNDVWIGSNAVLVRGITVGDGAVIGAGAVVTKDVSPYAVVAGSPAREIRKRFDDDIIERLLKTKWWEQPLSVISKMNFENTEECLKTLEPPEQTNAPSAKGLSKEEADQKIKELRKQIDMIIAGEKKAIPESRQKFLDLLGQKLDIASVPPCVFELLQNNPTNLYDKYDLLDPVDQVILNNKVTHIVKLLEGSDERDELSKSLKKAILTTFSTKH